MIDLSSDTASRPTEAMLRAMCAAELGDEQRRDDPTVNLLEARIAALLEKEAALLLPSATMANQIGLWLHCPYGGEVLCHKSAHLYNYEAGGAALNARAQVVPLDGDGGFFSVGAVRRAVRHREPHLAETRLIALENTTNVGGGRVWPDDAFFSVIELARQLGLALHLDGARLWNAAVKRGVGVAHWSRQVDTVSVCFSKGLGCPFGAVLAGTASNIERARWLKQAMGGALRQAGVIAGAMLYALDHHCERLSVDHERVARIASRLAAVSELSLFPVETNMLYFQHRSLDAAHFVELLETAGVRLSDVEGRVRLCTHLSVGDEAVDRAAELIAEVAQRATG